MLDSLPLIHFLHNLPSELILMSIFGVSVLFLGLFYRVIGVAGLYVFISLAVVIGNIQVLKAMKLAMFSTPVAMGTTVFMTTFLCTDLIAEFYGRVAARKAVWCGFFAAIFMTTIMILTLGIPTLVSGDHSVKFNEAHFAMQTLFLPAPAILFSSLLSYLISQHLDVSIFLFVKRITGNGQLWLRSFLSTAISSLCDNAIFSILAWVVFAPLDVPFTTILYSYILGTYVLRLLLTGLNTGALYALKTCLRDHLPKE